MSEVIFLSNVRLSFPHLAEPQRQVNEATGKERISYNCEFLMPQDHAGFGEVERARQHRNGNDPARPQVALLWHG